MAALECLDAFLYSNRYGFSTVGMIFVLLVVLRYFQIIFEGIKTYAFSRIGESDLDLQQYGKWAVVTGSTDGIGKSYARQLAKRKVDLILISRNEQKLAVTAEEITRDFGVAVTTIQADFTHGWELYRRIKERLEDEDIGILVNNVGLMAPHPCYFLSLTYEQILDIINVNVSSLLLMTTAVLPLMLKKRSGIVVNVCSLMSDFVIPLVACYGASKSLVNCFSLALYWENKYSGVYVQTLATSCVTTNLINFSNVWRYLHPFATDADTYSESAVRMLGKTSHSTGYWGHSVQYLVKVVPKTFLKYIAFWVNLLFIRNRPPN